MNLLHILFPQVRAEMMRLLFATEGRELHLRDLARNSRLALRTVQTELAKLVAADLVTSRRDGNRLYFRANASHPLFADLRQIVLKTGGLRDILAEALAELKGIELAFVFGSLAQNAGKAASDVDLFIVGGIGLRKLAPALRSVSEKIGREINPVIMSAEEVAKGRKKHPLLLDLADKEKLFIKGTSDEFNRLG